MPLIYKENSWWLIPELVKTKTEPENPFIFNDLQADFYIAVVLCSSGNVFSVRFPSINQSFLLPQLWSKNSALLLAVLQTRRACKSWD